jgi:hypothetical protein
MILVETHRTIKGILMATQKMFHGLRGDELYIHHPAELKYHDKKAEPSAGFS